MKKILLLLPLFLLNCFPFQEPTAPGYIYQEECIVTVCEEDEECFSYIEACDEVMIYE